MAIASKEIKLETKELQKFQKDLNDL